MAEEWMAGQRQLCLMDAKAMINWETFEVNSIERFRHYRKLGVNSQARVELGNIRIARRSMEFHARSVGKHAETNDRIERQHREFLAWQREVRNAS